VPRHTRIALRRRKSSARRRATTRSYDSTRRQTGIRVIGDMPWGTHICVFYQTNEDLLDTGAAYFKAGLQSNEFCVWAVADPMMAQLQRAMFFKNLSMLGGALLITHFGAGPMSLDERGPSTQG